jgi:hypothetical protein
MITKTLDKKNVVYDLTVKPTELKQLMDDIKTNYSNKSVRILLTKK